MRIGMVGCQGHWNYALAEWQRQGEALLASGYEGESMERARLVLEEKGIRCAMAEDWRALAESCGAVIVNTRFDRNAGVTAWFLERGVPVYSEKPVATTLEDLDRVQRAALAGKAPLAAMFGLRFTPWYRTVKAALPGIGAIRMIDAQKSYRLGKRPEYFGRRETFGGIVPWVAIHGLDWIHDAAGVPFRRVTAACDRRYNRGNGDMEMTALCLLEMEGGILASVRADYLRPEAAPSHGDDRLRVAGTEGVIESRDGRVFLTDGKGQRELPLKEEEDHFAAFLRGGQGVTTEESLYMTYVALKAREAADSGAWMDLGEEFFGFA